MISFIAKFPQNTQETERFLWSIESAFTDSKNIEVLFFGERDIKAKFTLPYRFFKTTDRALWDNMIMLSEKALGDILIFSDTNILYTDLCSEKLKKLFDANEIILPEIINSSDNRIIDYGTINYKKNTIYLYSGLLFDNKRIPSTNKVDGSSQLSVAVRKEFFVNNANKVDCFDKLFQMCKTNNLGINSSKDFVVYYCGDKILPNKTAVSEYKNNKHICDIFENNIRCLNPNYLVKNYLLVKIGDIDGFDDLIKCFKLCNIDIIGEYSFKNDSDEKDIDLFHVLPLELIDYHTAIIYFVSSFTRLNDNSLWFSARDTSYDIVIDKNLNVLHVFQIANNLV